MESMRAVEALEDTNSRTAVGWHDISSIGTNLLGLAFKSRHEYETTSLRWSLEHTDVSEGIISSLYIDDVVVH